MAIGDWFSTFCTGLRIRQEKRSSFSYRTARITRILNQQLRGLDSDQSNRFYVGSMGRNTAIPTVSDVDLLYVLPNAMYQQYNAYEGNKQSSLLSTVRTAIRKTYTASDVFGDGQVVVIAFDDGVKYEVLPAFLNTAQTYTFPDANNGGTWRECKPKQEIDAFALRNTAVNGNLIELSRMARAWRDTHSVPLSGMLIDTLAYQFMESWAHRNQSYLYYDFMTRDFFKFLANQSSIQLYWLAPGSGSYVYRKGSFEFKARQAELRTLEALEFQGKNMDWSAKQKYREIYGTSFPV
jgi:hypothetical protein